MEKKTIWLIGSKIVKISYEMPSIKKNDESDFCDRAFTFGKNVDASGKNELHVERKDVWESCRLIKKTRNENWRNKKLFLYNGKLKFDLSPSIRVDWIISGTNVSE